VGLPAFAGILAIGLVPVAVALWFVDNRRPQWRDRVALVGQLTAIGILAIAAFSFLTGSYDDSRYVAAAVATTAVLIVALVRWWRGHGRPIALLSVVGVVLLTVVLVNPLLWAFTGLGMLWFVALLLALLASGVLGRRGRGLVAGPPAREAPGLGPAWSALRSPSATFVADEGDDEIS
jgi:hypothetical protein